LQKAYATGQNILQLLRGESSINTEKAIQTSYDLQAGTATVLSGNPVHTAYLYRYAKEIANVLRPYQPQSLLDAGTGEGTTLAAILHHYLPVAVHGFDISIKRLNYAQHHLPLVHFTAASLSAIPYHNCAFDAVCTSHAIEPNNGREEPILKELHRVTRRVLILLEPAYELAPQKAQERMREYGYCRGLADTATRLGFHVVHHGLFPVTKNPLNPTGLLLIEKH
jgi:SAM-dependent methyltransferase